MTTELKPCPFCGKGAHFENDAEGWQWVACESCGMESNRRASLMEDCKPLLAEAWNCRAPDPVRALIATHAEMLEGNAYAYFELAYTRQTGWMAWITDKPGWCKEVLVNPDRKVLAQGQGDTPEEACTDAARATKGYAA